MAVSLRRILRANRGQSLVELTFIVPVMVLLAYGAIEVGSVISTYLTLTHTTREGANLASRGGDLPIDRNGSNYTTPDDVLDTIIMAAAPTMTAANIAQWRVIYSRIIQDPDIPCTSKPCVYIVDDVNPGGQVVRGNLNKPSKLGSPGTRVAAALSGTEDVNPGQTFHAIEVFYDYAPNIITYVGRGINTDFYDRTIFMNTSGT